MKCPKCGNELEEGKLLCEKCGEEIKYVPDFDIELEDQLKESISTMIEELAQETTEKKETEIERFETEDLKEAFRDYFPKKRISFRINRMAIAVMIVAVIVTAGVAGFGALAKSMENSYDYQYEKAVQCAAQQNYDAAVSHLERALALDDPQIGRAHV